jgi:hypothetical protein
MAHYAILDENNIVTQIIVGKDENEPLPEGFTTWEQYYGGVRTSYNTLNGVHLNGGTPFRKNYAGVGYTFDYVLDAFIPPKPYPSWVFNVNTCAWDAPTPSPEGFYAWHEQSKTWVEQFPSAPAE